MPRPSPAFACVVLLWSTLVTAAERIAPAALPESLRGWVPWVLDTAPERDCPYLYNSEQQHCTWTGPVTVRLAASGGRFTFDATAYTAGWLPLPGGSGQWPQEVEMDGRAAAVVGHDGRPAVQLAAGRHTVAGRFAWPALPDTLVVPPDYGLVEVTVDGASRAGPGADGQVWLKAAAAAAAESDRLDVQVHRLLTDELPLTVETRLNLNVAGAAREVSLSGVQLADGVPLALESPLPARLEADGRLRVQVRPGHWQLRVRTRQRGPTAQLTPLPAVAPWPDEEVWVFAARTALRLVEVRGGQSVDPQQTNLPADWRGLPAWRVTATGGLDLVEQRRGDPLPEPDRLTLARELWLDFDGNGYTVLDRLQGQITRQWRLHAAPPLALGRVLLNGEPQLITDTGDGQPGVEVRRGALDLVAESRLGRGEALPAIGWALDLEHLQTTVHLPPGWRLWVAQGVDRAGGTWFERWTLLDLFLVLVAMAACARLRSRAVAVLLLATLALVWHESGAPRQVWLHLLVALALLRVLPAGRLVQVARGYAVLALAVLALQSLAFAVGQVRLGLYPQLELPFGVGGGPVAAAAPAAPAAALSQASTAVDAVEQGRAEADSVQLMAAPDGADNEAVVAATPAEARRGDVPVNGPSAGIVAQKDAAGGAVRALPRGLPKRAATVLSSAQLAAATASREADPAARIQTGPGLPQWRWTAVPLEWSGPVRQGQPLRLWLTSPAVNLVLALLRVALLGLLVVDLGRAVVDAARGGTAPTGTGVGAGVPGLVTVTALVVVLLGLLALPTPARAELPGTDLLQELRQRLTRAPDCLPQCAEIARLRANLHDDTLLLNLDVQSAAAVAVPLPGAVQAWLPRTVLVDGKAGAVLHRDGAGTLWLDLSAGSHTVSLAGAAPPGASFQVPFPLRPQRLAVAASGWSASGQRADGGAEAQLIFTRLATRTDGGPAPLEPRPLPAFFRVERVLHFGLDWRVMTRVVRLTPADSAASLAVPLLPGEAVTRAEVRVKDGRVLVEFAAGAVEFGWESVLAHQDVLTLTAATSSDWVETWRADIAPLWHAELAGLAVVHHQDESGTWLPGWQPWPGEQVTITLTRPAGMPGPIVTIDNSALTVQPAARATAYDLAFTLRSSQGGQHRLTLPEGAVLGSVTLDGAAQPIRQEGTTVTLPVAPRAQHVTLQWHSDETVGTHFESPRWQLGAASVNARLSVAVPPSRWILLVGGPRLGPAVLFWGVIAVLVPLAFALGRAGLTPLRSGHWLLLGVGLTQVPLVHGAVVVAWLFALAARERSAERLSGFAFNAVQVGLALLSLLALALLFGAVEQGLLGEPAMQIAGNGSHPGQLNWFQDRVGDDYPRAWVLSVPLWCYRSLMLAWALWLALALLGWLRWGWRCFSSGGYWRALPRLPAVQLPADGEAPGSRGSTAAD